MTGSRELILSVGLKDMRVKPCRGSGNGGQHRNKNFTGCQMWHDPSGSFASATDSKSFDQNRKAAFLRIVKSESFETWRRKECARLTGEEARIADRVEKKMRRPWDFQAEVVEDGDWVKVDLHDERFTR